MYFALFSSCNLNFCSAIDVLVPLYHSDGLVVYCPSFSVSLFFMNIHFLDVLYNLAFFCTFMYTVVYFVLSIKKKQKKKRSMCMWWACLPT